MAESLLLERALSGRLVISDFGTFARRIEEAFRAAEGDRSGDVARYIPQLAEVCASGRLTPAPAGGPDA
jgi:hypothetical protein